MRFFELARLLHQFYDVKTNASKFVCILVDSVFTDEALEQSNPNPLYKKKKSTLEAYYSGRLSISSADARTLNSLITEERCISFMASYSYDTLAEIRDHMAKYGFKLQPFEVPDACTNILVQSIRRRAEGKDDNVTTLNYKRHETGKLIKNIAPATIERRGDKLHIAGEEIQISHEDAPETLQEHEKAMAYIRALYEVYAQKLKMAEFNDADIQNLTRPLRSNFSEQRMAYYSAISVEHSIRDVFDDGEDEFRKLKVDAWHGINSTYWRDDFPDGYARLNAVLDKITNTTLDGSVLSQIRNLMDNLTKKGVCHILVNDGVIVSWVDING